MFRSILQISMNVKTAATTVTLMQPAETLMETMFALVWRVSVETEVIVKVRLHACSKIVQVYLALL